jgi:hypothetical protein
LLAWGVLPTQPKQQFMAPEASLARDVSQFDKYMQA